jgi:hypothetical protein
MEYQYDTLGSGAVYLPASPPPTHTHTHTPGLPQLGALGGPGAGTSQWSFVARGGAVSPLPPPPCRDDIVCRALLLTPLRAPTLRLGPTHHDACRCPQQCSTAASPTQPLQVIQRPAAGTRTRHLQLRHQSLVSQEFHPVGGPAVELRGAPDGVVHGEAELARGGVLLLRGGRVRYGRRGLLPLGAGG